MGFVEQLKDTANRFIDQMAINDLEYRVKLVLREREELKGWKDQELQLAARAFREELKGGKRLDSLLVSAFAVVNEAASRVLGKQPYPVQILAGIIVHMGKVVEMKAGEGKTLMETMPVYLNALESKGVHIVTTNDYLAERDAAEMGKLYNFLGLSVGHISSAMPNDQRRAAYASDITYVSNQEIGFDYLRDNLVFRRADRVLRPQHPLRFGIVDEIDSILIDESRTPLIIAAPAKEARTYYDKFNDVVNQLAEDEDYVVDYVHKNVKMTDAGLNKVERILGAPVFGEGSPMTVFYLDVCLRAKTLFEKDRDYIITPSGVEIVDEFTGRVLPGRRFTDGVHQAIEAKEKVKVKEGDKTQASITFQNFFPRYEKLSGMSGTVMHARQEFNEVYKLDVVRVPTNRPVIRQDKNDLFFKTQKGKFLGMLKKIRQIHGRGQPLLIGTRNVETAHAVAQMLDNQDFPYQLLTASDNRAEAEKIKHAGQAGMITVATNMAGRGTDILLGEGVEELGGLFVLGTERHESRRIDDQLIGRSGRQGEPGASQFLISMEDEIMQLFGSEKIIDMMEAYDIPEDEYISGQTLDEAFRQAQNFVESRNYDSRIYLYKYDSVTSFQREYVYRLRDELLENEPRFWEFLRAAVTDTARALFASRDPAYIQKQLKDLFFIEVEEGELREALVAPAKGGLPLEVEKKFTAYLQSRAELIKQEAQVYSAAQSLILDIIDNQWSNQLQLMETLKEEASLFSYASQDPLIEYILEGKKLFAEMLD
ncbi:MAG: preprotein translocase subunit SecA, partial [Patescibacteria group bacterium]|nr:preprotein translocase subunit SecA [Patescibacteria group bacterium]